MSRLLTTDRKVVYGEHLQNYLKEFRKNLHKGEYNKYDFYIKQPLKPYRTNTHLGECWYEYIDYDLTKE